MYVRTKDWIYDTENLHYRWIENNKVYKVGWDVEKPTFEADIIKQSENLEELCDEFVYQTGGSISKGKPMISKNDFLSLKEWYVTGGINQNNIFGAIWTSKGLIYVAEMDNEGKLVLI